MARNTIGDRNNYPINKVHSGWQEWEDALLWNEVVGVRKAGKPLKCVFDAVSEATGRKSNSIRNYYYSKVRELKDQNKSVVSEVPDITAFVPFQEHEVVDILKRVLTAQAAGQSVRACTLEMGKGDNKAMLRYQNKYRSVIRNNPELVESVMKEMEAEGLDYVNPYEYRSTRGRKRLNKLDAFSNNTESKRDWENIAISAVKELFFAIKQMASQVSTLPISGGQDEVNLLKEKIELWGNRTQALTQQNHQLVELLLKVIGSAGNDQQNVDKVSSNELQSYVQQLLGKVDEFDQAVE